MGKRVENEELKSLNLETKKPIIISAGCSHNNSNIRNNNNNGEATIGAADGTSSLLLPSNHKKSLGLKTKAVFRQVLMVILANLAVLSAGMALGYPAVTLEQLADEKNPNSLSKTQSSWFASINTMSCPLGGLLSGFLLDKIGRKRTIFTINLTAIISWGLMTINFNLSVEAIFIQIMISRFIIGITTGLASSPVGVYSAEVCHPDLRGRLTLGTSISTAAGILIIYVLGYFIRNDWRLIAAIACGLSIFALILTIPIPESPNWLIMKGRIDEAENSLKFFRGLNKSDESRNNEFKREFQNLLKSIQANSGKNKIPMRIMLKKPEVYKPLLIMIGFFAFQQFGGIFVIIVYAVNFAIEAGVKIDPVMCAILIGLTRLLTTFLVGFVLDKWGRRPPALLSGIGMSISMIILASMSWFNFSIPHLPVICIIMYIFTSTLGLMTLPFSMISEVYPQRVRGLAAGITICCAFLMSFINIKIYPNMVFMMGKENVFAFYGIVSLLAVIYIFIFLPETKGKSLAEIEEYFRNGKKIQNSNIINVEMKEIFVTK